jgi:hypothetical protein
MQAEGSTAGIVNLWKRLYLEPSVRSMIRNYLILLLITVFSSLVYADSILSPERQMINVQQEFLSTDQWTHFLEVTCQLDSPDIQNECLVSVYDQFSRLLTWSHLKVLLDKLEVSQEFQFLHERSKESIELRLLSDQMNVNIIYYLSLSEDDLKEVISRLAKLKVLERKASVNNPWIQFEIAKREFEGASYKLTALDRDARESWQSIKNLFRKLKHTLVRVEQLATLDRNLIESEKECLRDLSQEASSTVTELTKTFHHFQARLEQILYYKSLFHAAQAAGKRCYLQYRAEQNKQTNYCERALREVSLLIFPPEEIVWLNKKDFLAYDLAAYENQLKQAKSQHDLSIRIESDLQSLIRGLILKVH